MIARAQFPLRVSMKLFSLFILALILASCAPISRASQQGHSQFTQVSQENAVGQTFLAQYNGLQGISVYLKPAQNPSGRLSLALFERLNPSQPVATASIEASSIHRAGFHEFSFSSIPQSTKEDYYFELTYDGTGELLVGTGPGNSYLNGALYEAGEAQNSQTAFQLTYDQTSLLQGLFFEGVTWGFYLFLALVMFCIPGWAALTWLYPGWQSTGWVSKICLSSGMGLVFYPLLTLWLDVFRIHFNWLTALLIPMLGLVMLIARFVYRKNNKHAITTDQDTRKESQTIPGNKFDLSGAWHTLLPDAAFLVLCLLLVFSRFWSVRMLDAPMWGDSYQHTMIAQLLSDNGGLFSSWEPYAQLDSLTYHFGFHSLVSNFNWVSGMEMSQASLWLGQILNILAVLALYPLAVLLGKNRWAGVMAVLIAGFLSSMPMVYVNWGRYTQLAGQIILPAITFIAWKNLDHEGNNLKWNSLVWFGWAGLALTHYRVTIFIPLFYAAYLLFNLKRLQNWQLIKVISLHAVGALVLITPWLFRLVEGNLPQIFGSSIGTPAAQVSQATQNLNAIGNISDYLPTILWILVLFAVGWGILSRNQKSNIFSLWWGLILLAANPHWLRLPGTGILTNFAVFIAAYIPAGILVGAGIASLFARIHVTADEPPSNEDHPSNWYTRRGVIGSIILLLSILIMGAWYVRPRIRDVKPMEHALLTRPDLNAVQWINENLPPEASFLVNSFFAYGGTLVAGSDGGWWLPLLTSRDSSQPPLTYGSEKGVAPGYVSYINNLVALIEEKGIADPQVLSELEARGITHLYIGQQQGQVNAPAPPILDVNTLIADPNYAVVYHEDRVWIFELLPAQGSS